MVVSDENERAVASAGEQVPSGVTGEHGQLDNP
jgi:hypothetical protein